MLLDIGIGIFSAIIVGRVFSLELTPLLIGLGIAFALLPDIDGVYSFLRNGHKNHKAIARHRDLIHYPLIYLPAGALAALPFGPEWSVLFLIASLGHFLHDSIGIGWGIPWLWPLTNKNYAFLYRYTPPEKRLPKRVIYAWERERLDELIEEYGDPNWFRNIYLQLHPFFLAEILFLVAALFILWHIRI